MPARIARNGVINVTIPRGLGGNMRTSERHQRHSLRFGLFLAVVGALLLLAALAQRANAGSTDYWDSEYPTMVLDALPDGEAGGGGQPFQVDALFSWTGTTNTTWSTSTNWSPAGPPGVADTAVFNRAFSNEPNLTTGANVGTLQMTTGVAQNVFISASGTGTLVISGQGIPGTGILVNNTNAFKLTITATLVVANSQAWTNDSGNLFTVGGTVALGGNALTVNGTGDTLISSTVSGMGSVSDLIKEGSGTLTLSGFNSYSGGTAVTGGTLLVNNTGGSGTGTGAVTVTGSGTTLGGTGIISGPVTVFEGASVAPGNGSNNTGTLQTGTLTLSPTANFRVDINGTTAGTFDQIRVNTGGVFILNSNLLVTVGTTLSLGQTFTILNKATTGPIFGTFAGIPEGGTVTGSNGTVFQVSYIAGDGRNDVVLTVVNAVPEPSTWIGGTLGIAGLAFTQRRRLWKLIARRCTVGS